MLFVNLPLPYFLSFPYLVEPPAAVFFDEPLSVDFLAAILFCALLFFDVPAEPLPEACMSNPIMAVSDATALGCILFSGSIPAAGSTGISKPIFVAAYAISST